MRGILWGMCPAALALAAPALAQNGPARPKGALGSEWFDGKDQRQARVVLRVEQVERPDPAYFRLPEYDWQHSTLQKGNYPQPAFAEDKDGRVRVRVTVEADGRASACELIESSGTPSLDAHACPHLRANARFFPALDTAGRRVAGSAAVTMTYELRLYMNSPAMTTVSAGRPPTFPRPITPEKLGIDPAMPRGTESGVLSAVLVGADGGPVACNVIGPTQVDAFDTAVCAGLMRLHYLPGADAAGKAQEDVYFPWIKLR